MSARAGQSIPVSNRPNTYDSLYATDLASDVVSIASVYANISFEVLATYLTLCIYLVARHYYGHVAAMHILILRNCYGITNLLLRKFTFTENETFLQKFSTMKIRSCHATVGPPP